jgi:hypothetical protein
MEIEKEVDRWRENTPVEEDGFFKAVEVRRAVGTGTEVRPGGMKASAVERAQILRDNSHRFSAPHVLSQLFPNASGAGFGFLFRRKAEGHVERTRADEGGQKKHNGQNAQNYSGKAGDRVGEVQHRDNNREKKAKKTICTTHVLFHGKTPS